MFSQCDTEFNLDRHIISFLQDSPFFAELSRHVRKVPSNDLPTAGVAFDPEHDDLTLYWNPLFFGGGKRPLILANVKTGEVTEETEEVPALSDREVRGVLLHEFYHLVFCHLTNRRPVDRSVAKLWNVATDLAINSIILGLDTGGSASSTALGELPEGCLVPGRFPAPVGSKLTPEQKAARPLGQLIEKFPPMKSSEWYFEQLREKAEEERAKGCPQHGKGDKGKGKGEGGEHGEGDGDGECTCGDGDLDSFDSHEGWDGVPEEMRELVASKVASIVEKAVRHADSQANGWGNMPAELRESIRRSVTSVVDWRAVLRQFVGSLERGGRTSSIKRINRRYPYVHPGTKRAYSAKLLIAIDMSGSVSNEMLVEFFGELAGLTKRASVTVLPFDCSVDERDAFEWKRGATVQPRRVRGGGTDFECVNRFANDPRNRGRWDGVLVLTDGEAPAPSASRIRRGWVLARGTKLTFNTTEMVVALGDTGRKAGAWR